MSAVHIERTGHPGPLSDVSTGQRRSVVRGGVEPPTFRFSDGRSRTTSKVAYSAEICEDP